MSQPIKVRSLTFRLGEKHWTYKNKFKFIINLNCLIDCCWFLLFHHHHNSLVSIYNVKVTLVIEKKVVLRKCHYLIMFCSMTTNLSNWLIIIVWRENKGDINCSHFHCQHRESTPKVLKILWVVDIVYCVNFIYIFFIGSWVVITWGVWGILLYL
jgi:hypothetical protein